MIKLVAFDLDNTLAEIGKAILPENVKKLKKLEDKGIIIAISSGKPVYYLCGYLRQVGLKNPILMGENGASIQFGVELPPKKAYLLSSANGSIEILQKIKQEIMILCQHDIWFQPNQVALTIFPKNQNQFVMIEAYLKDNWKQNSQISIYQHSDSFDITPYNINKGEGIKYLCNILQINLEDIAAVGDGANDIPMFEAAGLSIGITTDDRINVSKRFHNISDALDELNKIS